VASARHVVPSGTTNRNVRRRLAARQTMGCRSNMEAYVDEALASFVEDRLIDDTRVNLKSGKEATVLLSRSPKRGDELVAVKVYRPETHRSFTNDAVYLEGRFPNAKDAQALVRKRNFKGGLVRRNAWINREFEMLEELWQNGVRVPRPIARNHMAIVMEFIGTEHGACPTLKVAKAALPDPERLLDDVFEDITRMLECHCVHGDLSEYNMLFDGEVIYVIDLPQCVDPRFNEHAERLLARDVANVCRFFGKRGVYRDPMVFHADLWSRYIRGWR